MSCLVIRALRAVAVGHLGTKWEWWAQGWTLTLAVHSSSCGSSRGRITHLPDCEPLHAFLKDGM